MWSYFDSLLQEPQLIIRIITIINIIIPLGSSLLILLFKEYIRKRITESINQKSGFIERKNKEYQHELDRKILEVQQSYKKEIQTHEQEFNKEVERLRKDYENLNFKFQTKYITQHQKKIDLIENTYVNLHTVRRKLLIVLNNYTDESSIENLQDISKQLEKIKISFLKQKVYLSKKLSQKIDDIISKLDYSLKTLLKQKLGIPHQTKASIDETEKHTKKITTYITKDLEKILKELEQLFRKTITTRK